MKRRQGHVERTLRATFASNPQRRFTTTELLAIVYPGETPTRWRRNGVIRTLKRIADDLGLFRCRVAMNNRFGWEYHWGMK